MNMLGAKPSSEFFFSPSGWTAGLPSLSHTLEMCPRFTYPTCIPQSDQSIQCLPALVFLSLCWQIFTNLCRVDQTEISQAALEGVSASLHYLDIQINQSNRLSNALPTVSHFGLSFIQRDFKSNMLHHHHHIRLMTTGVWILCIAAVCCSNIEDRTTLM